MRRAFTSGAEMKHVIERMTIKQLAHYDRLEAQAVRCGADKLRLREHLNGMPSVLDRILLLSALTAFFRAPLSVSPRWHYAITQCVQACFDEPPFESPEQHCRAASDGKSSIYGPVKHLVLDMEAPNG